MKIIGRIETDFPDKFGLPRQSGIVKELTGKIIFEKEYSVKEAFEGIEDYSHLWILWQFSDSITQDFSPTVRPPRLNGNVRKGVFATRSPYRPNPIGLSCVKLDRVEHTKEQGTVLYVSGIDMKNGTPIYDIKPYITYADSIPEARQGFAEEFKDFHLDVEFDKKLLDMIPEKKRSGLIGALSQDPRPAYHNDDERIYGITYSGFNIKFKCNGKVVTVVDVENTNK